MKLQMTLLSAALLAVAPFSASAQNIAATLSASFGAESTADVVVTIPGGTITGLTEPTSVSVAAASGARVVATSVGSAVSSGAGAAAASIEDVANSGVVPFGVVYEGTPGVYETVVSFAAQDESLPFVNFVGPAGADGIDGIDGAMGPTGPAGAPGATTCPGGSSFQTITVGTQDLNVCVVDTP